MGGGKLAYQALLDLKKCNLSLTGHFHGIVKYIISSFVISKLSIFKNIMTYLYSNNTVYHYKYLARPTWYKTQKNKQCNH